MRHRGIRWQRIGRHFSREAPRLNEIVGPSSLREPAQLPESKRDRNRGERDRENTEDPFFQTHVRNIATAGELPLGLASGFKGYTDLADLAD